MYANNSIQDKLIKGEKDYGHNFKIFLMELYSSILSWMCILSVPNTLNGPQTQMKSFNCSSQIYNIDNNMILMIIFFIISSNLILL